MTPIRVVIDTDPGTDDAVAILVALGSSGLDVQGVTTVGGNADVEVTTGNALSLISAVRRDVPVFAGAAAPLGTTCRYGRGPFARPRARAHGGEGLGLPAAGSHAQDQAAADFLIDTFTSAAAADTVLVAMGPLTNVAVAILRQPRLKRTILRLILMGGSRGPGNATASADFNFWADPEAARITLQAGLPDVVMFPLDVTRSARLRELDCLRIEKSGSAGELAARLIRDRMTSAAPGQRVSDAAAGATVHDAFCTAHLVAPVVSESERCCVDVDTSTGATRGTSTIAPAAGPHGRGNAEVVLSARADILAQTIAGATRRLSVSAPSAR